MDSSRGVSHVVVPTVSELSGSRVRSHTIRTWKTTSNLKQTILISLPKLSPISSHHASYCNLASIVISTSACILLYEPDVVYVISSHSVSDADDYRGRHTHGGESARNKTVLQPEYIQIKLSIFVALLLHTRQNRCRSNHHVLMKTKFSKLSTSLFGQCHHSQKTSI